MSQPLTRLLVALNLAAIAGVAGGTVIAWQSGTTPPAERVSPDMAPSLPAPPAPLAFAAARNQPIFTPARRLPPAPAEEAAAGAPAAATPAPHLAGVLRIDAQRAMALLKDASSGKQEWVAMGRTIGGWTVTDIQSQEVRLERAGESVAVRLLPKVQAGASAESSSSPLEEADSAPFGPLFPPPSLPSDQAN